MRPRITEVLPRRKALLCEKKCKNDEGGDCEIPRATKRVVSQVERIIPILNGLHVRGTEKEPCQLAGNRRKFPLDHRMRTRPALAKQEPVPDRESIVARRDRTPRLHWSPLADSD